MVWDTDVDCPILVPRRDDRGPRDIIWEKIRSYVWGRAHVMEGHHLDGPFNRSAAINTAAKKAGDWDIAVIADSDSFVHPEQLTAAVALAKKTRRLVIPHSRWVNVTMDESMEFLRSGQLLYDKKRDIYNATVSSVLVVPREVWDSVNGFDQRFKGWGWEDVAFMEAVEVLAQGHIRLEGSVYHLAHARPEADVNRQLDPGYIANRNHWRNYKLAKGEYGMRTIVSRNMID